MSWPKTMFYCTLCVCMFLFSVAQAQEVSPYSRFGIGELTGSYFTVPRSLGGMSAAFRHPVHINHQNPASYPALVLTSLEAGLMYRNKNLRTENNEFRTGDAFVDYMAMAFPVSRSVGMSFGLVPLSSVRYNFSRPSTLIDTLSFEKLYSGNGRHYELYWGAGVQFPRTDTTRHLFSLGTQLTYQFGTMNVGEIVRFPNDPNAMNTRRNANYRVNGVSGRSGIQYRYKTTQELEMVWGLQLNHPFTIRSREDEVWDRFRLAGGILSTQDTVSKKINVQGKVTMPLIYGTGFSIRKGGQWMVGIDYQYASWSDFQGFRPDEPLVNSHRIGAGIEFLPDPKAIRGFLKRNTYRIGGSYETGYIQLQNQAISQYGITFGLSTPVKGIFSSVNIHLETGRRGTIQEGLIRENLILAGFGFTFSDQWFVKRKYD